MNIHDVRGQIEINLQQKAWIQGSVSSGRNWFLPEEWTSFFQKKPEETKILLGNDRKQLWNILKQLSLMVDET